MNLDGQGVEIMPEDKEICEGCGSDNVKVTPTIIDYDDGTVEENHDTLEAKCQTCGKEWLIVYM